MDLATAAEEARIQGVNLLPEALHFPNKTAANRARLLAYDLIFDNTLTRKLGLDLEIKEKGFFAISDKCLEGLIRTMKELKQAR